MRSQTSKEMLYGFEPNWQLVKEEFGLDVVKLEAQVDWQPQPCACNGRVPHKKGDSTHLYRGAPIHERQVVIVVRRSKYRCPQCGAGQSPELPPGKFTSKFRQIIGSNALKNGITATSEQFVVERTTVARISRDEFTEMMAVREVLPPTMLGLDNSNLSGQQRTVVVDLARGTHLDVFASTKGDVVIEGLRQYAEAWRPTLQCIVIDQSNLFRAAARSVFPDVPIVLDRFHVVMLMNQKFGDCVDQYRNDYAAKHPRQKLPPRSEELRMTEADKVEAAYLKLKDEWPEVAEGLLHARCWQLMYKAETEAEGREFWVEWAGSMPKILQSKMAPAVEAITRGWLSELCAPIQLRSALGGIPTNGITEALNNRGKKIDTRGNTAFDLSRMTLLLTQSHKDRLQQVTSRRKALDEELRELGKVASRLRPK